MVKRLTGKQLKEVIRAVLKETFGDEQSRDRIMCHVDNLLGRGGTDPRILKQRVDQLSIEDLEKIQQTMLKIGDLVGEIRTILKIRLGGRDPW